MSHKRLVDPLDAILLRLSESDPWTVRHACEGTKIFGAIGVGKTTTSGRQIATAFLRSGMGGLVLCAKADERRLWEQYARTTGRTDSLIVVDGSGKAKFNFMKYEMARGGKGSGVTENIVNLFATASEITTPDQRGQSSADPYWKTGMKQAIRNGTDLLRIAKGDLSIPLLYELLTSSPTCLEDLKTPAWQQHSLTYQCIVEGENKPKSAADTRDFEIAARYFLGEVPRLGEKTRAGIMSQFTGLADPFLRGVLYDLFSTGINIVPELSEGGAIILLDLSTEQFGHVGRVAQVLVKHCWQSAMRRRDIGKHPRGVFFWADEAGQFLTSGDSDFQRICRGYRVCTVFLSQNLPSLYEAVGGNRPEDTVDSLLGNLSTVVFHANSCQKTNTWASEKIGRGWQWRRNKGVSGGDSGTAGSRGQNEAFEYIIPPAEFTKLRKAGPPHFAADALVFQNGRKFKATGQTFMPVSFSQGRR